MSNLRRRFNPWSIVYLAIVLGIVGLLKWVLGW